MNPQEKKLELVQLILHTNKPAVLAKVEAVFKKEKGTDWWDEISEAERKTIEEGLSEADRGELLSHEEVLKEVKYTTEYNQEKGTPTACSLGQPAGPQETPLIGNPVPIKHPSH